MLKKILLFLIFVYCTSQSAFAECCCPPHCMDYKQYIKKIQSERAVVYNALNLTDEQLKVREDIFKENSCLYDEKFKNLMVESYKLKALKCAHAGEYEISKQKKVVKNIKKDINKLIKKENKIFEKCLTGEQKAKYSMIKKLERKDFRKVCKEKDYRKANPKLHPFGNPQS